MALKTPADGVNEERTAWMRWIRRQPDPISKEKALAYGKGRAARCQSKPGGVGKPKK